MNDQPNIVEVTNDNFEQTVIEASHSRPVVVDFWAEWCQPCKQLFPILTRLLDEYAGQFTIGKLNIDEQRDLAAEAGVRSVPMVLVFRRGMVSDQFLGLQPESSIRAIIERNLFRESDRLMDQARQRQLAGAHDEAAELGRAALAEDPDNPELAFQLAHLLVAVGQIDDAQEQIQRLPREIRDSPETEALLNRIELVRTLRDAPSREQLLSGIESDPTNSQARYQLAARYVASSEFEPALEQLLALLRQDREFGDGAAKRGMIAIFSMLDQESPLLNRYRTQMFNALH